MENTSITIVKLKGGLGNQMFQYACGRNFSLLHNSDLKLDVSAFSQADSSVTTPRKYALSPFLIVENIATPEEIQAAMGWEAGLQLFKKIRSKLLGTPPEPTPERLKKNHISYLDGYWQSEDYFKDNAAAIVQDFTLKGGLHIASEQVSELIKQAKNSVAVHIRRGDYVSDPATNKFHGVCSPEYYERALTYLREKIGNVSIFIFSDDIEWVKHNMNFPANAFYVSRSDIPDYEEMKLISLCEHNVIANSSFSWWGAWLNQNPNKIVIAPVQWFANPQMAAQSQHIIPSTWIKM